MTTKLEHAPVHRSKSSGLNHIRTWQSFQHCTPHAAAAAGAGPPKLQPAQRSAAPPPTATHVPPAAWRRTPTSCHSSADTVARPPQPRLRMPTRAFSVAGAAIKAREGQARRA